MSKPGIELIEGSGNVDRDLQITLHVDSRHEDESVMAT